MTGKRKRRSNGYAIFLTVYIAVVLIGAFIVLSRVWTLAEEYENSRPNPVIDGYVKELSENMDEYFSAAVASMEHPMQTDEECIAVIKEMLASGISCQRMGSADKGRSLTYSLECESGRFGKVEIHKDPSKLPDRLITFDKLAWFTEEELTPWSVGEAEFDFDGLYSSVSVTVPETYAVYLNGHMLGKDYIIEDDIHYDILERYYGDYDNLPVKVSYSFDKIVGTMEPVIYDGNGKEAVIDSEMDDSQFIIPCTEEEITRLESFCEKFLTYYVGYTSGVYKKEVEHGYGRLRPYIKSGSDIDTRMKAAQDGIYYAHSPATVSEIWLSEAMRLNENVYVCSTGYTADSNTPRGHEEISVEMELIIENRDGDLRVVKEDR